jgi:hypothetical protein
MDSLPVEIVLEQIKYMDNSSIKNLCKTSKRIHNICKNNKIILKNIYVKNILNNISKRKLPDDQNNLFVDYLKIKSRGGNTDIKLIWSIFQRAIETNFDELLELVLESLTENEKKEIIELGNNNIRILYKYSLLNGPVAKHPITKALRNVCNKMEIENKDDLTSVLNCNNINKSVLRILYLLVNLFNCKNKELLKDTNVTDLNYYQINEIFFPYRSTLVYKTYRNMHDNELINTKKNVYFILHKIEKSNELHKVFNVEKMINNNITYSINILKKYIDRSLTNDELKFLKDWLEEIKNIWLDVSRYIKSARTRTKKNSSWYDYLENANYHDYASYPIIEQYEILMDFRES